MSRNFGTVFVDQSCWQSAITAKPASTHKGYLLGGLVWFTIPFALAATSIREEHRMQHPFDRVLLAEHSQRQQKVLLGFKHFGFDDRNRNLLFILHIHAIGINCLFAVVASLLSYICVLWMRCV